MQQNNSSELGKLLSEARKTNGFSFRQLSVVCDVPRTTIIRLCHGKVLAPRISHLTALARQLEIPIDDVLARAGVDIPTARASVPGSTSLSAHLRAEFELTEWEVAEARQSIVRIIEKHRARRKRIQDRTQSTQQTLEGGNHVNDTQGRYQRSQHHP